MHLTSSHLHDSKTSLLGEFLMCDSHNFEIGSSVLTANVSLPLGICFAKTADREHSPTV